MSLNQPTTPMFFIKPSQHHEVSCGSTPRPAALIPAPAIPKAVREQLTLGQTTAPWHVAVSNCSGLAMLLQFVGSDPGLWGGQAVLPALLPSFLPTPLKVFEQVFKHRYITGMLAFP